MKAHQLIDFLVRRGELDFAQWASDNSAHDTPAIDVIRSTCFSQRESLSYLVYAIEFELESRGKVEFRLNFVSRVNKLRIESSDASTEKSRREQIEAHYVYRDKVAVLIADAIGFLYGDPERIVYEGEDK